MHGWCNLVLYLWFCRSLLWPPLRVSEDQPRQRTPSSIFPVYVATFVAQKFNFGQVKRKLHFRWTSSPKSAAVSFWLMHVSTHLNAKEENQVNGSSTKLAIPEVTYACAIFSHQVWINKAIRRRALSVNNIAPYLWTEPRQNTYRWNRHWLKNPNLCVVEQTIKVSDTTKQIVRKDFNSQRYRSQKCQQHPYSGSATRKLLETVHFQQVR